MSKSSCGPRFRPGDLVRVEVEGAWIEGLYVGFACGHGHVVRTSRTVVIIPETEPRIRHG
jgi:hypothetical protein